MVKVDILCNYWDDPIGLARMLQSCFVKKIINKIFILDGRYKERKDKSEYDIFEQNRILFWFEDINPNKIFYEHVDNYTQIEKRNKLWDLVEEDNPDFALVVDSDEYLEIDNDIAEKSLEKLLDYKYRCIPVLHNFLTYDYRIPRLFKGPYNFRHKQQEGKISHGSLYDGEHEIIHEMHEYDNYYPVGRGIANHNNAPKGIKIIHNKDERTDARLHRDLNYYDIAPNR